MKRLFMIAVSCFALSAGCKKEEAKKSESASETKPAAAAVEDKGKHAAKEVTPGSHEDWCGEHAVPESQCTRCNPELSAAFKATGDWCEEHGLPESQCLKCNPDIKIVRPPKAP